MTWYIKMLGTHRGSNTGHDVKRYYRDEVLTVGDDIGDSLARFFIRNGKAREVENVNDK